LRLPGAVNSPSGAASSTACGATGRGLWRGGRLERIVPVAPPRPLHSLSYGRDLVVEVNPENREGAEERTVEAALRLGGIVERIERENASTGKGAAGAVRVVLPEAAAAGFLDELRRIGTVPPEVLPAAFDIPRGPRPGTAAYTVRIRLR